MRGVPRGTKRKEGEIGDMGQFHWKGYTFSEDQNFGKLPRDNGCLISSLKNRTVHSMRL